MKRLSLRPYTGNLFVCNDEQDYIRSHGRVFKDGTPPSTEGCAGQFCCGEGKDGMWAYLVWHTSPATLAHELSHVLFHVFERSGMNAHDSGGEAFCYMLQTLMSEAAT